MKGGGGQKRIYEAKHGSLELCVGVKRACVLGVRCISVAGAVELAASA